MPVREKGQRAPVCRGRVPSHVPSHTQTAAKLRGFSPTAPVFTTETDSPLERTGFEPSVPGKLPTADAGVAALCGSGAAARETTACGITAPVLGPTPVIRASGRYVLLPLIVALIQVRRRR